MILKLLSSRPIALFGLLLVVPGLLSCSWVQREFGFEKPPSSSDQVQQPRDIPVPEDTTFKRDISYVRYPSGRKARVARYIYYSEEGVRYLDRFYRNNMKYGWEPSEYDVEGRGNLHFVSSNELCKIHIQPLRDTLKRRLKKSTKIVVTIEPIDNGG